MITLSTDQTVEVAIVASPLQVVGEGIDGQLLEGLDPSGQSFHLIVLSETASQTQRKNDLQQQLNRLRLVDHPGVRQPFDVQFEAAPSSFRLALRTTDETTPEQMDRCAASLDLLARVRVAGRIVEATIAAHHVGLCHGSFSPASIWISQLSNDVDVQIDFSGVLCSKGLKRGLMSIEDDLERLRGLFAWLLQPLIDDEVDGQALPISGRHRAAIRQWCHSESGLPPTLGQWRSVFGQFTAVPEVADQTQVLSPESPRSGSTSSLSHCGQTASLELDEVPSQLGRFRIVEKIGEGGMGAVYRAVDSANELIVAIKVLRSKGKDVAQSVRRFRKEARLLADAQNDHVTKLFEVGEDLGFHFIAMEFINGVDLKNWLVGKAPLIEKDAVQLAADLSQALIDAHARGVVHRDIKPENVLLQLREEASDCEQELGERPLSDFILKLTDFGIARHVQQSESMEMTRAGAVLGTPKYMSPEQCKSAEVIGPAADVYSIGITLFQMLTGDVPFEADDFMKLAAMHCFEEAPSVQKRNGKATDAVSRIVSRSLAKDPSNRYGDASQLFNELKKLLRGDVAEVETHPELPQHSSTKVWDKSVAWTLQSPAHELWRYVSNTERLNEAIGLPAVNYRTENDPELGLRKFGSFTMSGIKIEWEEHPFEWIEGRRMGILREFDTGPFKWFLSTVTLNSLPDGGTELTHRVTIEPRNLMGRVLTTIEADWKGFRNLTRAYQRMDRAIGGRLKPNEGSDAFAPPRTFSRRQSSRLRSRMADVIQAGIDPRIAHSLETAIEQWAPQELAKMRPLAMADRIGVDGHAMTEACLAAASKGVLRLQWDVLCPTCRVSTLTNDQLSEIEAHTHCEACDVDFKSNLGDAIEMVFRVHPEIREVDDGQYCIGGPEHSPHVVAQLRLEPGESLALELDLGVGDYLVRGPRLPQTQTIRVQDTAAPSSLDLKLSCLGTGHHIPKLRLGRQVFTLTNDLEHLQVARVERLLPRDDVVTATAASAIALFRKLFPLQQFSSDNPIATETMSFLATRFHDMDSVYAEHGDAAAYELIQKHHRVMEEIIKAAHGTVVKTIGEQLLACFQRREQAASAAVAIRNAMAGTSADEIPVGMALHCGPTLVTTQNNQLDYFGSTLRAIHSLPDLAGGDTLVTEAIYTDPIAADYLKQLSKDVDTISVPGTPQLRVKRLVTSKQDSP